MMPAPVLDFFAHPRAPAPPTVSVVIPIRAPRRDIRQLAHDSLVNDYQGALAGSASHRMSLEAMVNCRNEPELAGLARIALSNLDRLAAVAMPCDCEQGDLA